MAPPELVIDHGIADSAQDKQFVYFGSHIP